MIVALNILFLVGLAFVLVNLVVGTLIEKFGHHHAPRVSVRRRHLAFHHHPYRMAH